MRAPECPIDGVLFEREVSYLILRYDLVIVHIFCVRLNLRYILIEIFIIIGIDSKGIINIVYFRL